MPVPRGPWGWHPHGARLRQPGYAPLTTLLYRSVLYSPWLASIIVRRILSCSIRFLSTSRLARRKRMMPEGKPMALQDSQAGDEENQRGHKGPGVAQTPHCSALQAPEMPHPTPPQRRPLVPLLPVRARTSPQHSPGHPHRLHRVLGFARGDVLHHFGEPPTSGLRAGPWPRWLVAVPPHEPCAQGGWLPPGPGGARCQQPCGREASEKGGHGAARGGPA